MLTAARRAELCRAYEHLSTTRPDTPLLDQLARVLLRDAAERITGRVVDARPVNDQNQNQNQSQNETEG